MKTNNQTVEFKPAIPVEIERQSGWLCELVNGFARVGLISGTKEDAEANAARIAACVNGCKDVSETWFAVSSSSTPIKDLIEENGLLGEENQSLRKQLAEAKNEATQSVVELGYIMVILETNEPMKAVAKLKAERDTLNARCEKLEGYAEHKDRCRAGTPWMGPPMDCTCGLDELRKQGKRNENHTQTDI